jgi:hypothetical protein
MKQGEQYEIRFRGNLGSGGQEWFDGFSLRADSGVTVLSGVMIDQSTLYGVLSRIRDLNLQLISVNPVGNNEPGFNGHQSGHAEVDSTVFQRSSNVHGTPAFYIRAAGGQR